MLAWFQTCGLMRVKMLCITRAFHISNPMH